MERFVKFINYYKIKKKLLLRLYLLFCLLLKDIVTQNNQPDFDGMQQLYEYNPYKVLPNIFQQYPNQVFVNNKWNPQDTLNYEDYNDYTEESACSCENCDDLKPSCRNMCPNCALTLSPLPGPGYFFLQYPYAYSMPSKTTPHSSESTKPTVTTTVTTTETTTQRSTEEVELPSEIQTDVTLMDRFDDLKTSDTITKSFRVKDKRPYVVTSLRRTKPNWIPKYGIVPISNQFAEKLMLQMRSMKVLQPRKDNFRDVDEITPVN